jgi:hypothetical protein
MTGPSRQSRRMIPKRSHEGSAAIIGVQIANGLVTGRRFGQACLDLDDPFPKRGRESHFRRSSTSIFALAGCYNCWIIFGILCRSATRVAA